MKVIFLDIDGVLNTNKATYALNRYVDGSRVKDDQDRTKFDPIGVGLINNLIEASGAKVVLSSAWRITEEKMAEVLELMQKAGFRHSFLDVTPRLGKPRGREIKVWIDEWEMENPEDPVTNYVIFDDDSDMLLHQMPHFCKCPYGDGITWSNYCEARRILDIWD